MKARQDAAEFKFKYGYEIPVHFLAQKVADNNQIYTQHSGKRAMAATMILGG